MDGQAVNSLTPYTFHFQLFDASSGGTLCPTEYDATAPVLGGEFSLVVGPVAAACVIAKPVYLAVSVKEAGSSAFVALNGRQQVYPALGALTSGSGDFSAAGGNVTTQNLTTTGTVTVGTNEQVNGNSTVTGTVSAGTVNANNMNVNGGTGVLALNDRPIYLRGSADPNHVLTHTGGFGGVTEDGALLTGYGGGILGSKAGGDKVAIHWDSNQNVGIYGNLVIVGSGGNTPHQCVTRSANNSYSVGCLANEIAMGGGASCDQPNHFRIIESRTDPYQGNPATGWYARCEVWGNAGIVKEPYNINVICCQR